MDRKVVLALVQAGDYSDTYFIIYFIVRAYLLIRYQVDENGKSRMTQNFSQNLDPWVAASLDGGRLWEEQIWYMLCLGTCRH